VAQLAVDDVQGGVPAVYGAAGASQRREKEWREREEGEGGFTITEFFRDFTIN